MRNDEVFVNFKNSKIELAKKKGYSTDIICYLENAETVMEILKVLSLAQKGEI